MKGNILLVVSGIVVVGATAYKIYRQLQFKAKDQAGVVTAPFLKDEPTVPNSDLSQIKEDTVSTIKDRHTEAARIINESLHTIFDEEKTEEVITENSHSLDKMDDDLNSLLT